MYELEVNFQQQMIGLNLTTVLVVEIFVLVAEIFV